MGKFMKGMLCSADQKLTQFTINQDQTNLTILSEQEALKLHIQDMNLLFEFDYEISTDPEWISDEGQATVEVFNTDVDVVLTTSTEQGILKVDFTEITININEYKVRLEGQNDVSKGIEILFRSFKSFFKQELTSIMSWRLAKSVQETINQVMLTSNHMLDMPIAYLNMTLIEPPIYGEDRLTFVIDGSFLENSALPHLKRSESVTKQPDFLPIPIFVPPKDGKLVQGQIFVSQYMLNSMMSSIHSANLLKLTEKANSTGLKTFFANFEEVFGKQDEVKFTVNSVSDPQVKITQQGSTMKGKMSMRILNPFKEDFDIARLQLDYTFKIEFELTQGLILAGLIRDVTFTVTEMETFFTTKSTTTSFTKALKAFNEPFMRLANEKLYEGYGLPMPGTMKKSFTKTRMFNYDGFLLIESDPQMESLI